MVDVWKRTLEQLKEDSSYRNMFHMLEQYGDDTAAELTDKDGNLIKRSFAEYVKLSLGACGNLQRMGFTDDGEVVGLIYETCMDWPVLLWGILMSGRIPLLMNPGAEPELNCNIMKEAVATAYVAAKPVPGCDIKFIDAAEVLAEGTPGEEKWGQYVALCTSGTTGSSRIFLYDSQTIANHILSFDESHQYNPNMPATEPKSKILAFLPFHHVFGFSVVYILYAITGKTLVYLKDKSVNTILGACQKHGVTDLYCIPMFFNALAQGIEKQLDGKDIRKLPWPVKQIIKGKTLGTKMRYMISGGGHIPESTLEIINYLGYPLTNGFGMTETGIITVNRTFEAEERVKGGIGFPFGITEWKIVPEDKNQGELYIRGEALYSASIVNGQIVPRDKSAWFATGDIVNLKPDGLYISGRAKDVIIGASGENIYPEELEDDFEGLPGVKNYCIIGIDNGRNEDVTIIVEPGDDFSRDAVSDFIKRANEKLPTGKKLATVYISKEQLPVSGNMKVRRGFLKKHLEDGSWPCESFDIYKKKIASLGSEPAGTSASASAAKRIKINVPNGFEDDPQFTEILDEIKNITAENLGTEADQIGNEDHFIMVLGGDSLSVFTVFSAIGEKYDVEMMDEEMVQLENVYDTAKFVYAKMKGIDNPFVEG